MTRLAAALALIDEANAEDPRRERLPDGTEVPVEWIYGRRMSGMLARHHPDAGELLQIAVRAQHIRRWTIARASYPMDRAGYHRWRNALKAVHAEAAGAIMARCGYDETEIARVASLVGKRDLKTDAEAQALEDTACLVFLAHYAEAFAQRHDTEKMAGILRKTLTKMSPAGRDAALAMELGPTLAAAVAAAMA